VHTGVTFVFALSYDERNTNKYMYLVCIKIRNVLTSSKGVFQK